MVEQISTIAKIFFSQFPLVSRSGKIRRILTDAKDSSKASSRINLRGIPGGPEAFELAAKFCYGVNVEISLSNVAMLRCAAHYLEMTEEFGEKNLETRTEIYLKESVIPNISDSITVLRSCQSLLPAAEEINLSTKLINAIASNACKEQLTSGLSKLDQSFQSKPMNTESEKVTDWWGNDLTFLSLDFFQRLLSALKSKGLKQEMIGKILMNYAEKSLQGFLLVRDPAASMKGSFQDMESQKKQRVIVEAVVTLLPNQSRRSPIPMAFLSGLLKTANLASASAACRSDLERRMGLQLEQAILEDVMIPANSNCNHQSYDTDSILRIFSFFLNLDEEEEEEDGDGMKLRNFERVDLAGFEMESPGSPKQSAILNVSKLLDAYLAEVALDSNMNAAKFVALAELLPDHARVVSDGLYRAVDIFLKVHPNMKESDKYRLCKTIDCQKLSQEACSHAAQNERLPVQMAVQVLYFEQIRLRNAMNGGGAHPHFFFGSTNGAHYPQRSGSGAGSGAISPRDNYASVRRENRELKLEVARMRMRLTDLEKDHVSMKHEMVIRSNPANKILRSFRRKLTKLNLMFRIKENSRSINSRASSEPQFLFQRRRCRSLPN